MTVKRVSLKISPDAALRVSAAREQKFLPLAASEPLIVLGAGRTPEIIAPSVVPSPTTFFGPRGACLVDPEGPLWICDTGHHRLLGWKNLPTNDTTPADWQIGQKDFASEGRNGKGDVGPATVNVPTGICASEKGLIIADAWNHRVLIWHQRPEESNTPADIVLGQKDFFENEANRGADHPGAATLHWPYGVYYSRGKLFVADTGNRRVLIWDKLPEDNGTPADCVLGQKDFITRDENAGADPSAMSMRWPHSIVYWQNHLCVSDAGNNRVLVYNGCPDVNGATADFLLGQIDCTNVDFNQALYWPRSNTFNMPYGMTSHGAWLIIADTANSRILGWHINELSKTGTATALLGQIDFHEKGDNRWQATTMDSICWPYAVQASGDMLVISDSGNNRVSIWKLEI